MLLLSSGMVSQWLECRRLEPLWLLQPPILVQSTICSLLLLLLSSFSPYFIFPSFLILPYRLLSYCLSDAATHSTTNGLWCVHLPTAADSHKHLPSQHCDIQHDHDATHPNDHIQCHN